MIPIDSPVYQLCENLFMEQGLSVPFASYPWSEAELRQYLSRIEHASLSAAGKKSYQFILDTLKPKADYREQEKFAYDGTIFLNAESYVHANLARPEDKAPEDYIWTHGYEARLPILNLALEFRILDWLYLTSEIEAREEHMAVNSTENPAIVENHWNIFNPAVPYLDINFPFRAFTSFGGDCWTVELGRDQLSWGNGNHSNLILSDYADFYDLLSFTTFFDNFKYAAFNMSLEPYSPREPYYPPQEPYSPGEIPWSNISFLGHRFEVKLYNRVNLALFEVILSTLTPDQFFKELNHMNIYHNWLRGDTCYSIAALECNVNPWKYLNLYGQVALDEFKTAYEAERGGGGGAAKIGVLLGIEGIVPLDDNYLNLNFEWATTDPFLYHRRAAPYFYTVRRIWSLVTDDYEFIVKPIGHKYGPDIQDFFFRASYSWLGWLDLAFDVEYLLKGETTVADDFLKEGIGLAPSGIASKTLIFHTKAEFYPWSYLSTGTDLYWIDVWNQDHIEGARQTDFEWAWYVKFHW